MHKFYLGQVFLSTRIPSSSWPNQSRKDVNFDKPLYVEPAIWAGKEFLGGGGMAHHFGQFENPDPSTNISCL